MGPFFATQVCYKRSFVCPALVPQPPVGMLTLRVVMSPVNHATLWVGAKLAEELDRISLANAVNARSKVDVVSNQKCTTAGDLQNESLVPRADKLEAPGEAVTKFAVGRFAVPFRPRYRQTAAAMIRTGRSRFTNVPIPPLPY